MSLTTAENNLYTKLVQEYNKSGLETVCSLDQFLKSKWENETDPMKANEYYNIWVFACEDF